MKIINHEEIPNGTKYNLEDNTNAVCLNDGTKIYYGSTCQVMYLFGVWQFGYVPLSNLNTFPDLTESSAESFQFMTAEEISNELLEIQQFLKSIQYLPENNK